MTVWMACPRHISAKHTGFLFLLNVSMLSSAGISFEFDTSASAMTKGVVSQTQRDTNKTNFLSKLFTLVSWANGKDSWRSVLVSNFPGQCWGRPWINRREGVG